MSPLVSTSEAMKPVLIGEFGVRVNGAWVLVAVHEVEAWTKFIDECRIGRCVELLRNSKVLARLGTREEREIVLS
jgi:hypothetical protein